MYNLTASAYANDSNVEISISGMLANSCVTASVVDTFPGSIVYIVDPGEAQVFI